jgi:hypothetical protein
MTSFTRGAICLAEAADPPARGRSWAADNGNGTYSNPLF